MIIRIFLTLCLSLTMQSCRSSPETTSGFTKQDEGDSECQKWKNEVSSLSQGEIERLSREGAVRKEGVGLILSDSLVADCRLRNEMARILFLRPMPATIPALLDLQKTAERVNNKPWQILNLALLQKMGNASALPKLRKLLRDKHLPDVERRCVTTLIAKAERGDGILFSDIENLEYEGTIPKP